MESPTIRTRKGSAAVGSFGLGGTVVGGGTLRPPCPGWGPDPGCEPPRGAAGVGPDDVSPTDPLERPLPRPVTDTMCESPSARLSAATGPTTSRLTVRRVPTGETWALCCSVGANSRNHTAKAPAPRASTRVQRARTRPSAGGASSACGWDCHSEADSHCTEWGGVRASVIRSGSR